MPIYEYRCAACDSVVEIIHGMTDESARVCEVCGAPLERLISRSSFALKGDGWYADLYSSSKKKDSTKDSAAPAPAASSSGESKSTTDSSSSKATTKTSVASPKSSD